MQIVQQKTSAKTWRDEEGLDVPFKRTTDLERKKESSAFALAKEAIALNEKLTAFKQNIAAVCEEILQSAMTDQERKQLGKGNFIWYNFDGSVKIEKSINENIDFDSILIEKARQKFLEFVGDNLHPDKLFIKDLVLDAFQTSKGKLDTKKILGLKKRIGRIKDKRCSEAMAMIDESVRRPNSKTYYRVSLRNDAGEYEVIDLNFSSI